MVDISQLDLKFLLAVAYLMETKWFDFFYPHLLHFKLLVMEWFVPQTNKLSIHTKPRYPVTRLIQNVSAKSNLIQSTLHYRLHRSLEILITSLAFHSRKPPTSTRQTFMASDDWRMEGISMSCVIVNDLLYFIVDDLGDS